MHDSVNLILGQFFFIVIVFGNSTLAEQENISATKPNVPRSTNLPCVVPPPVEAVYGDELIPLGEEVVCSDPPREPVHSALREIVESWKIPLSSATHKNRFTEIIITIDEAQTQPVESRLALPTQGYLLKVIKKPHGASITIQSGDAAGAYYALQSLKRLVGRAGKDPVIRPAVIRDWPAFHRRGLILGAAPTEILLGRLRLMADSKMNFLLHCGIRPQSGDFEKLKPGVAAVKEFCDAHGIEFCYLGGYGDWLSRQPIQDVLRDYEARYRAGLRSFTVNFDDLGLGKMTLDEVRRVAEQHAAITNQIYRHLKALDANVRFLFCPVPYGGIAGKSLTAGPLEAGMLYLKVAGEKLAPEIPFFWTGDGGVWSDTITVAGAEAFGRACGRKPFLWDNDAIRFMNQLMPLSGREAGLPEVLAGYVGNVNELETRWSALSGGVIETIASYTWNPRAYDSRAASQYIQAGAAAVRERLKALGIQEVLVSGNQQIWENAFDRDPDTAWNSGGPAPGWIELVFDRPRRINKLIVTVTQTPAGITEHEIVATFKDGSTKTVYQFSGQTGNGQILEMAIRPKLAGVTKLRLVTRKSSSWVAWAEIDVLSSPG